MRLLHLDLIQNGASTERLAEWLWSMHWFPHLRWRSEITDLAQPLPAWVRTGTLCDPQILLQFPHVGAEPQITFHIDEEPRWASGRRYTRIIGVPLSPWRDRNGGLRVLLNGEKIALDADPGDAVVLEPDLPHSGGVNRTGIPRYAVYFRFIDGAPVDGESQHRPAQAPRLSS